MSGNYKTISGNVQDWQPQTEHVSKIAQGVNNKSIVDPHKAVNFIEAGTVLICSGPATLESAGDGDGPEINVLPIGLIEQASVQQSRPLQRIFEIGSKISYIIPGRAVGGIALNRMLFDGPSLLRMLTAGEYTDGEESISNGSETVITTSGETFVSQIPGANGIDLNFMSSKFEMPFGLMMYFRDQSGKDVSATYFEGCRMSSHSFSIASQATIIAEAVNMEFTQVVPVQIQGTTAI